MYFLRKAHIGEVHSAIWPEEIERQAAEQGILML